MIKCQLPALASDPEGLCILHSRQPDKDGTAFDPALQEKLSTADYDFRGVFFSGPVSFAGQVCDKSAKFRETEFAAAYFG